jgi:hypothetical protein
VGYPLPMDSASSSEARDSSGFPKFQPNAARCPNLI